MITENYCSDEVANLLKEKGFNESVTELNRLLFKEGKKPVLKITLQKAMKWLREVHNIKIEILITGIAWFYNIATKGINGVNKIPSPAGFTYSYEDAVEAAVKYSLKNLI